MAEKKGASHAVVAAVSKTDEVILRLNTLLSSKAGQDTALSVLNYGSHSLHHLLASTPLSSLRLALRLWLLQALGRDVSKAPPPATPAAQPPLLAFSALISKTRYTLRLLDLLGLWKWGSSVYKSPPKDPVLRALSYAEVATLVVYQALENVTLLAANGITGQTLIKRTGGDAQWTLWSTRAWFAYVLLQFVRLPRESHLFYEREEETKKRRAEQRILTGGEKPAAEDAEIEEAARQAEIRSWRKRLVNNLAWAPLCAHWSFENGIGVPPSLTGFISLLAGLWGTYDAWEATAP